MTTLPATKDVQTVGELVDRLPAPEPVSGSVALMRLIERAATSPDFDVAKLEKLLEVRDRWEAGEARKAFVAALNAFKAAPPKLIKNKHAGFESRRTGDRTDYDYLTLDNACAIIGPELSKHGLSHRWETQQVEGKIVVACILTHELGHSERVTLEAGADTSGSKNPIQAIGSTISYLQRYTLLSVTGLAASGMDDDGRSTTVEFISAEQKEALVELMKETAADTKRFLGYLKIDALDDLPASRFEEARRALEAKRKKETAQ